MALRLTAENGSRHVQVVERPSAATETFPSLTEGESRPTWPVGAPGVGIDRLSISFPVSDYAPPYEWDKAQRTRDGRQTFTATIRPAQGGPAVMVGVALVAEQFWGKVECNPARFADPDGCELLPASLVGAAVSVMWAAAGELTAPDCELADARVKRLDVARDFRGVTSPALYVEGLGPLKRPYARRAFTYNDPQRGNAQTLYVGSGAGGVRLYDQHAAYAEKGAPAGSVRWEVEARGGWLQPVGVRTVRDLDAVAVDQLAEQRWEWSKMGTTVTGPVNAVQLLQRHVQSGDVKQAVADRLLGAMVRQSFGYGGQTERSERRHRDVMTQLGLTAGALWSNDLSTQALGRLDFETGTEELALSG